MYCRIGFGWEFGTIIASLYGFSEYSYTYAIASGIGDCLGVFIGHMAYCILKYIIEKLSKTDEKPNKISLLVEVEIAVFLSSASLCSGTSWQPVVNFFQGTGWPILAVVASTWVCCGCCFFLGIKLFRCLYSPYMNAIPGNAWSNLKSDILLSVAVGGGSGVFVMTDATYLNGRGNFLVGILGIYPWSSSLQSCSCAGLSTAMGFMFAQYTENVIYAIEASFRPLFLFFSRNCARFLKGSYFDSSIQHKQSRGEVFIPLLSPI